MSALGVAFRELRQTKGTTAAAGYRWIARWRVYVGSYGRLGVKADSPAFVHFPSLARVCACGCIDGLRDVALAWRSRSELNVVFDEQLEVCFVLLANCPCCF